jgi:HSP20 family protein
MATALARRRLFPDFGELQDRLDRMFEDLGGDAGKGAWRAPIDVVREEDKLRLRVEMPGITPDDIKIELDRDILTVSGEHEEEKKEEKDKYIRRERRYGSFTRSMALPPGVDANKIAATTKDGVLEVTIPLPGEPNGKGPVTIKPKAG